MTATAGNAGLLNRLVSAKPGEMRALVARQFDTWSRLATDANIPIE